VTHSNPRPNQRLVIGLTNGAIAHLSINPTFFLERSKV
jgi:hypothetical protein